MKMSILGIEYKNIRKISELKLSFIDANGNPIKNNFVMMANGTGKTTTMGLIKGLFDGTAVDWDVKDVKQYAPKSFDADMGWFKITVKFDERLYIYTLYLDYSKGEARIETATTEKGGANKGRLLPDALKGIFTPEFVRRFIFDGEQAEKTMDSSSNEAEETIRYLYRLDELDEIIAANQRILSEIQDVEGSKGSKGSLSNLRTRQESIKKTIAKLKERATNLRKEIKKFEDERKEKVAQRDALDKNYDALNQEKQEIIKLQQHNKDSIDSKISEIIGLTKSPYLISQEFSNRMYGLGSSMTKLKLPKTISKDFFVELAHDKDCICGRCIGESEKKTILENAEKYLGSDQQSVLNAIKSSLMACSYDSRLSDVFVELSKLREEANRLQTRFNTNVEKLLKAGGEEAAKLKQRIDELEEYIAVAKYQLDLIESKDESNEELTADNNLYKAWLLEKDYEQKIAAATRTNAALYKKEVVEKLVADIKEKATAALKKEIIRKTNEKIQKVIMDDFIEIENIDRYIKLKDRDGASEGQTLGIAYSFLGTLFEDSELEFPFVIDSPTGKMDFDKRQAVADIIPNVFYQMIAFVQSAEVERFADRFYDKSDAQYLTIIASPHTGEVEVHEGIEFFDSYQHEHKGDEE